MDLLKFLRYMVRSLFQGSYRQQSLLPGTVVSDISYECHEHQLMKGSTEARCCKEGFGKDTSSFAGSATKDFIRNVLLCFICSNF